MTTSLQRALARAPDRIKDGQALPEREVFLFKVGSLHLGVPSENVREVIRPGVLTALPRAPGFLLGVCGHRGEVLPVMDLLRFLGQGETRWTRRSRLFIAIAKGYQVGVLADSVLGLGRIRVDVIAPPPLGGEIAGELVIGVCREANQTLRTLLDLEKILTAAHQRVLAR